MQIPYLCLLVSALMPFVWTGIAKFACGRSYDNHAPRAQQASLEGWRARAYWAHLNSFEAFPPFAAAVLAAVQAGVPAAHVSAASLLFVVARGVYGVCYIQDWALQRSLVWMVATGAVIGLFGMAIGRTV